MAAKILYTQAGSDGATLLWPPNGPTKEQWKFTAGAPLVIPELIGYGDGTITFADGRVFPKLSSQGSTFVHQKN